MSLDQAQRRQETDGQPRGDERCAIEDRVALAEATARYDIEILGPPGMLT